MNYCSKVLVISFFIIVRSSQLVLAQEDTQKQVQASTSKTVEQLAPSNSSTMYGPISIRLVNESVISAIKKVAVAAHLKPVLDYDLIKTDKKVNFTLEVASLSEVLDQILQDMEIQYSITESGLLVFTQVEKPKDQSDGSKGPGIIKGSVLDKANGEPLVGANVVILNTSLGIAADIDGNYEIKFVPVGTWKMKVSCIGYVSVIREVTVAENETLQQDFRLVTQTLIGEVVVVTAQARGQVQAINQQLASNKISNVVSEARIQELPDFNAAQAIGRLPGISTLSSSGEANKVVVRGLAPQYNQITIGGISLASTGSTQIGATSQGGTKDAINTDRSVDISMISPYMLKSISVYKTLTPDMNANSLGGTVNMELQEAPSELHTDLMWQSGYTQKSNMYGNYRAVASVSDRFFNDNLGVYVLGNAEQYDRNSDDMTATYFITDSKTIGANGYLPVELDIVTLNRHIETRKRYGGDLILDYRLPSGSIKLVNMFTRLNSNYQDYDVLVQYKLNKLGFTYGEGNNTVDAMVNSLNLKNDYGFISVDLTASNTYSRNYLPYSPFYQFNQTQGVTTAAVNTIPEKSVQNIQYKGPNLAYLTNISLFTSDYKENNQAYKVDFKVPFHAGSDFSGYLKFGGEYHYDLHNNAQNTPYATLGGNASIQKLMTTDLLARYSNIRYDSSAALFPISDFTSTNTKLTNSFLGNQFGNILWAADPSVLNGITNFLANDSKYSADSSTASEPGGWFDGYYQRLPNTYKYIERYYGSYLMSELNFDNLMIVGGVRYEEVRTLFQAYNLRDGRNTSSQTYYPITVTPGNHFWLPMVQTKLDVTDWFDVRYAYTQTLARPDYHQLSPHYNMDYSNNNVWAGNPNLKTAQSFNHDVILTVHSNYIGLFSIGGFYKTIKDFTYATQYSIYKSMPDGLDSLGSFNLGGVQPNSGAKLYTYINSPYDAYIKGIEVDFQTRLWYLPVPFDGIVLGANYTRISSKATYPWRDARTTYIGHTSITTVIDSSRTGRLINQPNDIMNAYIGYDYKGFSARLSYIFTGNSVSYVGAFAEQDGYTKDYGRIDASVRQLLPWGGIEIYLDLNNLNGENNSSAQQSINGFTSEENYGFTGNLGIRIRL